MTLLKKLGRALLLFAVFIALLMGIGRLTTYFTAERYFEGAVPSRLFPVVKVVAEPARYELLRWHQVKAAAAESAQPFRLKENKGSFTIPDNSGYDPEVRFKVGAGADGRQRIEVDVIEDDYVIHAAYETDGTVVKPEYLRVWGPSAMLLALFPSAVLTLIFARVLKRRRERAAEAATAPGATSA